MKTNNIKKILWGVCFFLINGGYLFGQVSTDDIMSRIRSSNYVDTQSFTITPGDPCSGKGALPLDGLVAQNLTSINPDGSWEDINYADKDNLGGWEPTTHLNRVLEFAMSYSMGTTYKGDTNLYAAIVNAMNYYYDYNPTADNWWHTDIAAPQKLGLILIFMREGNTPFPTALETNILDRLDSLNNPSFHPIGANRIDVAAWHMYQALLRDNASELSDASDNLFNSLVTSTETGIMHDYSYQSHGPQLYDYGYGFVMFDGINKFAKYLSGSAYALQANYLNVYSNYLLGVYAESLRGGYASFNPMGRGVSRKNATRGQSSIFNDALIVDPANAAKYQLILDRASGVTTPGDGIVPKNTTFYRSNYSTHNRPEFSFSVRTASQRVARSESLNKENTKSKFLTEGATSILIKGDEYFNIFPVWDWTKIPGVTAPNDSNLVPGLWGRDFASTTFTGGVSSGSYGMYTYAMDDFNTEIKKSWFCFDDEIVCLGAGLNSTSNNEVNTTVNQCFLNGSVIVSENGTPTTIAGGSSKTYNNTAEWVLHDNIGYFFPESGNVKLSNVTQNGAWSDINELQCSDPVSEDVFKLWFTHGLNPSNDSYAYIIAPGKNNITEMQNYNLSTIKILKNTPEIQAVKHETLDMIQVVFYQAGSLILNGIKVKVDKPCSMVLSNVSTTNVAVNISDPSEKNSTIKVYWESSIIPGVRELECSMPMDVAYLGSTKEYEINTNTPLGTPTEVPSVNVIALEDAYVKGGVNKDLNFSTGDLNIKDDSSNGDVTTQEAYVKFDLSSLADRGGVSTLRFKTVSNNSINTYKAYLVSDDSWEETSLTWNNKPETTTLIGSQTENSNKILEWDISEMVNAELLGDKTITIKIVATINGYFSPLKSREATLDENKPTINFIPAAIPEPSISNIIAIEDAYVKGGVNKDVNFSIGDLNIKDDSSNGDTTTQEAYVKFDLRSLPTSGGSSILRFKTVSGTWINTYKAYLVTDDSWGETTLTWNNKPAMSTLIGSQTEDSNKVLEWDISELVNIELQGDKIITIKIVATINGYFSPLRSRETAIEENKPTIRFTPTITEAPSISNIIALEDAYVMGGTEKDVNFGSGDLYLKEDTVNGDATTREAYVKFDLSSLSELGGTSTLRFKVAKSVWVNSFEAYLVSDDSWSEETLTWNNKPESSTLIGSQTQDGNNILEWDISNLVNAELSGNKIITIKIVATVQGYFSTIRSRDTALEENKPTINFIPAICTPTGLDTSKLPSDKEVVLKDMNPYSLPSFLSTISLVPCNSNPKSIVQNPSSGTLLQPGTHPISITVLDFYGNTYVHTFNVDVDTIALSVSELDNTNLIIVYPTVVVEDKFNIDLSVLKGDIVSIEIYDLTGKRVSAEVVEGEGIKEYSTKGLQKGVYLLRLTNQNLNVTKKIIIN